MKKRIIAGIAAFVIIFLLLPLGAFAEEANNLVRGMSYTVSTGVPTDHSYMNYTEDGTVFFEDSGQLTDGIYASAEVTDDGWFRAFRSNSCLVTFEFENLRAVSGVKASFLNAKTNGIYAPRYINVYISGDGISFGKVLAEETGFDLTPEDYIRYTFEAELDGKYKAKTVVFEFCCDIFAYCDEIEVFGEKVISGEEKEAVPYEAEESDYIRSIAGVSDIIKLYNGFYPDDQKKATLTEEMILPYIAYIDSEGNIADTMFDSVAFVPCHTDYPSGGRLVKTGGKDGAVMADWEYYYDLTFRPGQDLDALDKIIGKVYSVLGKNEKFKVFLTLPYPTVLEKPFGDIDGDGLEEDCRTLSEREDILKWYILKYIKGFSDAEFENIELAGFYWYREEVNYSDSADEASLVNNITEYIRKKKLVTLFDPFYLSVGYDHWQELGFDAAVMQPNYAFRDYFTSEMLPEYAVAAKSAGTGTEIETAEPYNFTGNDYLVYGRRYESYLYYGKLEGFSDALKTYYQGAGPGSFYDFCYADKSTPKGQYLRRLYDLTYKFIKGSYENLPPVIEASDFELDKNDKCVVDISVTDDDSYWGDLNIIFPIEPAHGKVTASASRKTLIYIPDTDYTGEDFFTAIATDGFGYSNEIEIHVTVNEPSAPDINLSVNESGSDTSIQENNKIPWWLWATFTVLALLIVISAIAVTAKQMKNKK